MEKLTTRQLFCIKVTHTLTGSKPYTEYITFNQFEKSFIKERWEGERRTNKKYTIFGYVHTKTTVKFNDQMKSVRVFDFPATRQQAVEIHNKVYKGE